MKKNVFLITAFTVFLIVSNNPARSEVVLKLVAENIPSTNVAKCSPPKASPIMLHDGKCVQYEDTSNTFHAADCKDNDVKQLFRNIDRSHDKSLGLQSEITCVTCAIVNKETSMSLRNNLGEAVVTITENPLTLDFSFQPQNIFGYYAFKSVTSDQYLTVKNEEKPQQAFFSPLTYDSNQIFYLEKLTDGQILIRPLSDQTYCLVVIGHNYSNNSPVGTAKCQDSEFEHFKIITVPTP